MASLSQASREKDSSLEQIRALDNNMTIWAAFITD
jgi:flagellar biosynthesis regulator FlaF